MEKITKDKASKIAKSVQKRLEDDYTINVSLVRRKVRVENFVMLFQEAVTQMLDGNISKNGLRIFVYMLGKLEYSNHIGVDQETIAKDNGLSLVYIKKTIKELKDSKILVGYQDQQDKRRNVYIINPVIAWRGKIKHRKTFIDKNQLKLIL